MKKEKKKSQKDKVKINDCQENKCISRIKWTESGKISDKRARKAINMVLTRIERISGAYRRGRRGLKIIRLAVLLCAVRHKLRTGREEMSFS